MTHRELDIEKLRQETPGCANVIHFNNAGSSLMPKPVFDSISAYQEYELQWGGYETAERYSDSLNDFYPQVAGLIGADPSEIAFAESATNAWDIAFFSIPFQQGDKILTTQIEYASNYIAYLQVQKRTGAQVVVVESNEFGEADIQALEKELQKGSVRLISMTHIPTNGGIVNPAEEIGKIAEAYNILYLLDACQSAGQYPLDVRKLKCDFLSATGRKYLRGPRGTGFLYVSSKGVESIEPLSLDLHSAEWTGPGEYKARNDARKFEKWESNLATKIGLSTAVNYCQALGIDSIWKRVQHLAEKLREGLMSLPSVEVLDLGRIRSGIVTFRSKRRTSYEIKNILRAENINTSVAVASGTLLDMKRRNIETAVRASVHYYNTEEEIIFFLEILSKILKSR